MEHRRIKMTSPGRLVLGAVILLQAGLSACRADTDLLSRLSGTWNNNVAGETLKVEPAVAGWDIWLSDSGRAALTASDGSTVKIRGKDFTCDYQVTIDNPNKTEWKIVGVDNEKCFSGVFTKEEHPPTTAQAEQSTNSLPPIAKPDLAPAPNAAPKPAPVANSLDSSSAAPPFEHAKPERTETVKVPRSTATTDNTSTEPVRAGRYAGLFMADRPVLAPRPVYRWRQRTVWHRRPVVYSAQVYSAPAWYWVAYPVAAPSLSPCGCR